MDQTSENAKTKNKRTVKKGIIIVSIVLASLLLISCALYLVAHFMKKEEEVPAFNFYEPDYGKNIFEDAAYMQLNHNVFYKEFGSGRELNESNFRNAGVASKFFYEYFDALLHGDVETYRSFLTEDYIKNHSVPERFTMQTLYRIEVDQFQNCTSEKYHGEEVIAYYYSVSYTIFRNDGTFERETGSNMPITRYYVLYRFGDSFKINDITKKKMIIS